MGRMGSNLLCFFILASLLAIVPLTQAHAVTQVLKINEVEMNPLGEVSENQWIELYNQGDEILNIGGWLVKSTKLSKTFPIPDGFVVLPRDYLVIPFHSVMLDIQNESIVLLTQDSVEVDRTHLMSDTLDDDRTWQRFPNGLDTGADTDWAFRNMTIGQSNGAPERKENFTLSAPLFVDQAGNKVEGFTAGQMAGVKSEIINTSAEERTFTYIVKITDEEGFTVFLSWVEDLTVFPNRTIKPSIFWFVEDKGSYLVEIFVWRSLNIPDVLTRAQSNILRVAG